jgi:hypothetical protein
MMRHLFDAFGSDPPTAEYIGEKWPYVIAALRTAE